MKKLNYDFSGLENAMFNLKTNQSSSVLNEIRNELNKFFKDSTCKEVMYTKNIDKPFFGMCVIPVVDNDKVTYALYTKDKVKLSKYYVEIDSKLLSLSFSAKELTAMILHEIGHLVNDATPIEEIKKSIDIYMNETDSFVSNEKSYKYKYILRFGIVQGLVNLNSLFKKQDDEIIADQFSVMCGYGEELESAYRKIIRHTIKMNKGVPKLVALQWSLRLYKNLGLYRVVVLRIINKALNMTGSELQKRELNKLKRDINAIKSIEESSNLVKKVSNIYKNFKYKGIRSLEDDLYEINLRVKNCDEKDEALALLRMINTRLAIIDDYMHTEGLNTRQLDRCSNLINKYNMVRSDLSKKTVYDQKYYGLFVQTPVIKSRYEM